ncbi:hypothetical protein NBRC116599_36650 [Aquicoccus sp. SU-CL01552]
MGREGSVERDLVALGVGWNRQCGEGGGKKKTGTFHGGLRVGETYSWWHPKVHRMRFNKTAGQVEGN